MTTINTVEPEPVYPFTIFAKSRPQIQEIAEKLGTTIIEQNDNFLFFLRAELRVSDRPAPSYSEREHILNMSAHGLKERLRSENISKEERIIIQEEIISIKDEMNAPRKKHEEETARLSELITLEKKAYADWLTNDPEGIAATLADNKYRDYHEDDPQQSKKRESNYLMKLAAHFLIASNQRTQILIGQPSAHLPVGGPLSGMTIHP